MKILSTILLLASPLLSLSQITISDWDVSAYLSDGKDFAFAKVEGGVYLNFTDTEGDLSLVQFSKKKDFDNCNITKATVLAENTTEYAFYGERKKKPYLLASGVSDECESGAKIMVKYMKRKFSKLKSLCVEGSTELVSYVQSDKSNTPAKNVKSCTKECAKNGSCMGGEFSITVTGKGKDKQRTRSCVLYSDPPVPSGDAPEKRNKAVCFYPRMLEGEEWW